MSADPAGVGPVLKGRAAPDFTLPMPEGEYLSLQELRGKKILLVFLRHFA
ncbi:MAG: redoxin domain-containing protein [Chloroflexi bacterium]|nr:redoxin domain-containing protein [Chloroflexota bacterium]MCI0789519.1 redoxin domain-containing protein [Chloroflexota bacterium]MCI0864786.1 redoxin domain-containing protein [Chloroflexota bacterium]MCI0896792.1 redoxin domain-containing protein [Chloroflexota bacterium]